MLLFRKVYENMTLRPLLPSESFLVIKTVNRRFINESFGVFNESEYKKSKLFSVPLFSFLTKRPDIRKSVKKVFLKIVQKFK